MTLNALQVSDLCRAALAVRRHAYAPYSNFLVGAALLTSTGKVVSGCNVENASYGLTLCAERNAVTRMIADGEHEIIGIAVACSGAGSPCGACRQVLAEFGGSCEVILVDADSQQVATRWRMQDLLPHAFKLR